MKSQDKELPKHPFANYIFIGKITTASTASGATLATFGISQTLHLAVKPKTGNLRLEFEGYRFSGSQTW